MKTSLESRGSSVTLASLMMNLAILLELKSTASKRSRAQMRAVFSIEIGNKCSTFGRLNEGENSDTTSTLLTLSLMGAWSVKLKSS